MLMAAFALFAGQTYADDVTIDFNNDIATIFPSITSYSSGTGANYVADGEFNETTTSASIGGVTVTVTASDPSANTRNRLWASNPRLRLYDGSITFASAGEQISKIVMTISTNKGLVANDNTADSGTLSEVTKQTNCEVTWTGKAQSVTITIAGNTQFSKAVVTLGEGGEVTPPTPVDTDVNVAEALAITKALADGASTSETYNVKGIVVGTPDFQRKEDGSLYGNVNFTMGDKASDTELLTVYRAKYFGDVNFTEETIGNLKEGDEVIVTGELKKFVKDDVTTLEIANCHITSINGKTSDNTPVTPIETTGDGTLANPYTAADAIAVAGQLASGALSENVYIKGKISSIKYPFDAEHGTATFFISADGTETDQFQVYSTYYLNNRAWVDGDTQVALGDEVIVYGQITNYQGTPETAAKKSYIYSLNGVTDGGEVVVPDPTKVGSIAELLAMENTNNVELTLTNAKVLFNDGNYIYLRENGAALCFYKIDAVKSLFKNNAVVSGTIRVDYEVYKLLPEVKANNSTSADNLTVTESEDVAVPTPTTLTNVDNGDNVCDLVTLTAKLVRKVTYKTDDNGQTVISEETGEPVVSTTTYYLQDDEAELVVVNNSKNLRTLADEGVEMITVTGIVNTANNAYQIKLTKDAEPAGQSGTKGDVNEDGTVDVADISNIISIMAAGNNDPNGDVNGDGSVDVADISNVISIMAGGN